MTAWDFANSNPGTAFMMLLLVVMLVRSICYRTARTLCIRKQGWPTAPIDADGDVVWPDEDEEAKECRQYDSGSR
jgi:hypothetical protein